MTKHLKVTSGILIPKKTLHQANIDGENVELELRKGEIRIHTVRKASRRKIFTTGSPLWKCVGFAEAEGVNGKDHDRYIYEEER